MRRYVLVFLVGFMVTLVWGSAWGAEIKCRDSGILSENQVAQGATTNTFKDLVPAAVGMQVYIDVGTATVSIQACCRNMLTNGCTDDSEWFNLGGCVQALDVNGTRNMACAITPTVDCKYRGFIATSTCSSCQVDFTYKCSNPSH